ncbi:PhoU-like phosphate uptake regulator [Breoghania corrubedonensis]|uniref:Phosphate-specific transport system accessory protein PhoU n=1 Tax=Breoghania corrubedonensis TaxID=665038 RepID=A0A2T5VEG0_9HYPH|nr:phosphate signaling complex protein PhoU [Breoghania corrubedonensis]PTW62148.1 PhoU-like phosphate uptake regulator [Breoghania corrubedonensis]
MSEHIVTAFDQDLKQLAGKIAEMGGLAETIVNDSITALMRMDGELAQSVIQADRRLDALQFHIEDQSVLMIARRQPMAGDLRQIVAAMRTCNELERVGDLAKNIAKRVIAIGGELRSKKLAIGVEHMAELAMVQLKTVLDAYTQADAETAKLVRERDEEIDRLYTSLFRELLTYMMEDPRNITFCAHLLFCAKNIERIGDHATNIAENVHYMITGQQLTDERPRSDEIELADFDSDN